MIVVIGVFQISVRGKCTDKLSALLLRGKRSTNLVRNVFCVLCVKDILQRQKHIIWALQAVHIVIDSNETNSLCREKAFQVKAHINVIASKARKIFYDDTVNLSAFNVLDHTPKGRAVKICARKTVVGIVVNDDKLRMSRAKVL